MIDAAAQLITAASCLAVLVRAEPAINRMQWGKTPALIMLSFWCMAVGSIGLVCEIMGGYVPSLGVTISAVGVASLLICERRIRYLSRQPAKTREA